MLIDTHCHLNTLSSQELDHVIASCPADFFAVDSSIDHKTSLNSLAISGAHPFIYSSLGFHPFSAQDFQDDTLFKYASLVRLHRKVIAIGEIGLDYKAVTQAQVERQEEILCSFIELAKDFNLPVIIHNRMESTLILEILDRFFSSYDKVIFHCFSYPPEVLKKIIVKGGFVSFSLNVLRKTGPQIASLIECPLRNLLLETDSPYMKIEGKLSTPLDIKEVYAFTSSIKNVEEKKLEEIVFSNACKIFPKII